MHHWNWFYNHQFTFFVKFSFCYITWWSCILIAPVDQHNAFVGLFVSDVNREGLLSGLFLLLVWSFWWRHLIGCLEWPWKQPTVEQYHWIGAYGTLKGFDLFLCGMKIVLGLFDAACLDGCCCRGIIAVVPSVWSRRYFVVNTLAY